MPRRLCDTSGMSRDEWLACRRHGPYGDIPVTIGGSDAAVVLGLSPWKTPLELWREKAGYDTGRSEDNLARKAMGHMMEPVVAHWYGAMTGHEVIPETGLFQHDRFAFALANLDYRFREASGAEDVLEIKTTTYRKADEWADGGIPPHYEIQCRYYMAVMDLECADIACLWGMSPENDMAIRRIERDRTMERDLFVRLEAFVSSVRENRPPSMRDVDPALALKALARMYARSRRGLPTVALEAKLEPALRRVIEIQSKIVRLKAGLRALEQEADACFVPVAEAMRDHEDGLLVMPDEEIRVAYATRVRQAPDVQLLKAAYPDVYRDVLKETRSRKPKVTVGARG